MLFNKLEHNINVKYDDHIGANNFFIAPKLDKIHFIVNNDRYANALLQGSCSQEIAKEQFFNKIRSVE